MPNISNRKSPNSQKLTTFIKDEISMHFNDAPKIEVHNINENILINVNFENTRFRIDKTYKTVIPKYLRKPNGPIKNIMQIFIGLPACDMKYENLKEMFATIYNAYFKYWSIYGKKNSKETNKNSNKKSTSSNGANSQIQNRIRIIPAQCRQTNG